jgi:ATP-dependent DNA helicase RecG
MSRTNREHSGDVMVEIFDNRVTISNPGGLVTWLPPEDFGKYSRTRNRLIASLLMRTQQAEKMGTGIRRIQQALEAAGNPPAKFDYDDYNFSITLLSQPRQKSDVPLNEGLKSLLKAIHEHPGIQAKDLAKSLRRSIKTVEGQTKALTDKNLIERRGSKKTGGYWPVGAPGK